MGHFCCRCGSRVAPDAPASLPNGETFIKGAPVVLLSGVSSAGLSDKAADCTAWNAVTVEVYASGTNPSATVSIEGSPAEGGNYLPLIDPNASQSGVTTNRLFEVICGSAWVKARLANVTGLFTVIVTPFISPGPGTIIGTVT